MDQTQAREARAKLLENEDELRARPPEWFYQHRKEVKDLVKAVLERRMGEDGSVVHSGMGRGKIRDAKLHFNILFRTHCDERTGCRSLNVGSKEAVIEVCPRTQDKKKVEIRLVYKGPSLPGCEMRVNRVALLFRLSVCEAMAAITSEFEKSYYDGIVATVESVVTASAGLYNPTPRTSNP